MTAEALISQFGTDPDSAFVDIIRTAPTPVSAQLIKRQLIEAGIKKDDVDRHWKRIQRVIKLHPQISMVDNRYEWLAERRSAQSSLDLLAGRLGTRQPRWLTAPWLQNVMDALKRAGADDGGWAEHQFQQARLVARLADAVEAAQTDDGSFEQVTALFGEEKRRKRLWPLATPGDNVAFNPAEHTAGAEPPEPGTVVRVVRSGYVWRGAGTPTVAVKAVVAL